MRKIKLSCNKNVPRKRYILFLLKNCIHDFKYALLAPKFNVIRTSYIYTQTEKRDLKPTTTTIMINTQHHIFIIVLDAAFVTKVVHQQLNGIYFATIN